MNAATILELVKARIGISSSIRDSYLLSIITSVIDELKDQKGITLSEGNMIQQMFIVDYATWRYQSRDESGALPRYLQFRLHNLMISDKGTGGENV